MTADGAIFWKSGRGMTTDGISRPSQGLYLISGVCGGPDADREAGSPCRRQLIPADTGKH
ncbi:MAG: hypothetical protein GX625_17405 [Clostridiaceae bacterium]|nr:hypothetical protein [Clostridiaceae bacterium]